MDDEIKIRWTGEMQFVSGSTHGQPLVMDASPAGGGRGEGIRPVELLLHALGGCTGMDVISILQKKRMNVRGFELMVKGNRAADHPRVYNEIEVEYVFRGKGLDPAAIERAIQLSEEKYCSVRATLVGSAKVTSSYRIVEED